MIQADCLKIILPLGTVPNGIKYGEGYSDITIQLVYSLWQYITAHYMRAGSSIQPAANLRIISLNIPVLQV